jgi:hypothetical protein
MTLQSEKIDHRTSTPLERDHQLDYVMSCNSVDQGQVESVARKPGMRGAVVRFARWCLIPGGEWREAIAGGLTVSSSCNVFDGPDTDHWDSGSWVPLDGAAMLDREAGDRRRASLPYCRPPSRLSIRVACRPSASQTESAYVAVDGPFPKIAFPNELTARSPLTSLLSSCSE